MSEETEKKNDELTEEVLGATKAQDNPPTPPNSGGSNGNSSGGD
jgi:hypothetical protein